MFCKKCGSELPGDSIFCLQCGEKIPKEVLVSSNMGAKNSNPPPKVSSVALILVIVGIIVFVLAYGISRYSAKEILSVIFGISENENTQSNVYSPGFTDSTEVFINKTVKELKKIIALPKQINEVTLLVDITAEPKAIRWHYVIYDSNPDVDLSLLTNDSMKNNLASSVCSDRDTQIFFENGVNAEYSYIVNETQKSYLVIFTKNDCLRFNQDANATESEEPSNQNEIPNVETQIDNAVIKTAPAVTIPTPIAPTLVVPTPAEPISNPEIIENAIVNAYESAVNSTIIQRNALISARFNSDKDYARNKEVFLTASQKEAIYNDDYSAMQSELADVNTRMGYLSSIKCDIYYCPPMSYTASDLINAINDLSYELDQLTIAIRSQGY